MKGEISCKLFFMAERLLLRRGAELLNQKLKKREQSEKDKEEIEA